MTHNLNSRAAQLCEEVLRQADALQVAPHAADCGTTLIDFGIEASGSEQAGLLLARLCLADLAEVELCDSTEGDWQGQQVTVTSDEPIAACMASQYAGWEVKGEKYFAMGSGPMRAAAGREPLFDEIGYREEADRCLGVLESAKLPPDDVCRDIAEKCGIEPQDLVLLVAPTSSIAGTMQVVARSVETALHKLHEIGYDLSRVEHGRGIAPLPPLIKDDFAAIGVTNDAILYGGNVTLHVRDDDEALQAIGPQIPSSASADYGRPFGEVLASYNNDFYQVDPLLFSAARVTLYNLDSGNSFTFGQLNYEVLSQSFDGK